MRFVSLSRKWDGSLIWIADRIIIRAIYVGRRGIGSRSARTGLSETQRVLRAETFVLSNVRFLSLLDSNPN